MRMLSMMVAAVLLAAAPAVRGAEPHKAGGEAKKAGAAAKPEAVFVNPDDLKWGDPPPQFPKGGQVAVLHGDPHKKGVFTIRFKMPDGYRIAPHWHTQDENLTIVSGALLFRMGDTMDASPHELGAGAFHFLPGKQHHSAEAKGATVVQIHGTGPFDIHYLNPADDPSKKTSAAQ